MIWQMINDSFNLTGNELAYNTAIKMKELTKFRQQENEDIVNVHK